MGADVVLSATSSVDNDVTSATSSCGSVLDARSVMILVVLSNIFCFVIISMKGTFLKAFCSGTERHTVVMTLMLVGLTLLFGLDVDVAVADDDGAVGS